jgi:hypothetical protein
MCPEEVEATPPAFSLVPPMVDDIEHSLCPPLQRWARASAKVH